MASIFLMSIGLYSAVAIKQNPFALHNTNNNGAYTIDGQYLIFFDTACLTQKNEDAPQQFLDLFQCYKHNTKAIDLYPDIGDHWIVVNRQSNCILNENTKIEFSDYCITSVEQDETITTSSKKMIKSHSKMSKCSCECASRTIDDELWNLDSLTPKITNGFEFVQLEEDFVPGFDLIVMDSGVAADHSEFDGIIFDRIFDAYPDDIFHDHGTHVAGTFCGYNYGAFRAANTKITLLDVRVLSSFNNATSCDILNGYCAIIKQLKANKKRKAVINMSFSGGNSDEKDKYLKMIKKHGGIMIAAAGNAEPAGTDPLDACLRSPASSPHTIAVGNIDQDIEKADGSNWGICVDIFAPGTDILSADMITGGASVKSGTSMASPLVAAVAANILAVNPKFDFSDIKHDLLAGAKYDVNYVAPNGQSFSDEPRLQGSCKIYGISDKKMCSKKHKKRKEKSHAAFVDNNDRDEVTYSEGHKATKYVVYLNCNLWIVAGFLFVINMFLCCLYHQPQNKCNI